MRCPGHTKRRLRLPEETPQAGRWPARPLQGQRHVPPQVQRIDTGNFGEVPLGMIPNALVGIELGYVRRQTLQVQPREALAQSLYPRIPIGVEVAPDLDQLSQALARQLAPELLGALTVDVLLVDPVDQSQPVAPGADRRAGDHRQAVMAIAVAQARVLGSRSPGPADRREHIIWNPVSSTKARWASGRVSSSLTATCPRHASARCGPRHVQGPAAAAPGSSNPEQA